MDLTIKTEDLITTEEAAQILGVSRPTVYNYIIRYQLPQIVIARNRYLFRYEVEALKARLTPEGKGKE